MRFLIAVCATLTFGASNMAFAKSLVLASAVEGRVLANGEGAPVAGAEVVRRWTWGFNGRKGEDITTTDDQGRFAFDTVTGRSLTAGLLPHEPSIRQEITTTANGASLVLLSLQKANYDDNGELNGQSLKIRCRTDLEADSRGFFWGTCELDD